MKRRRQRGFTLMEVSLTVLVLAVFLIPMAETYARYERVQAYRLTQHRVDRALQAVIVYYKLHGRYPCPAPLNSAFGSSRDGVETDCANTTVDFGRCADGICISEGRDEEGQSVRIRRGALPYVMFDMPIEDAYDGYGMRLQYAVTEDWALSGLNEDNREPGGGIDMRGANGESLIPPPGSASFVVFSTGADGAGGYDARGNSRIDCQGAGIDRKNCSRPERAVFYEAPFSRQVGPAYFDDVIAFHVATKKSFAGSSFFTHRAGFICPEGELLQGVDGNGQLRCGRPK